ncbi:uncharacterized protein LOC135153716 [Lytechinus pictus]|uniref:uncharacterized protein LOC135153716 n=1 Tax=Lytechinus pictus TaxID=7653 RepID=UPI0030B9C566
MDGITSSHITLQANHPLSLKYMMLLHLPTSNGTLPKYAPYFSIEESQEWENLLASMEEGGIEDSGKWPLVDILMDKESQNTPQRHLDPTSEFSNDEQQPIQAVHLRY